MPAAFYGAPLRRGPGRAGFHSTGLSAAKEEAGRMTGRRLGAGLAGDVPAGDHVCINAARAFQRASPIAQA